MMIININSNLISNVSNSQNMEQVIYYVSFIDDTIWWI